MLRVDFCVATKRLLLTALPADFPSLQVSAAEAGAVSLCFQALAAVFVAELVAEVVSSLYQLFSNVRCLEHLFWLEDYKDLPEFV